MTDDLLPLSYIAHLDYHFFQYIQNTVNRNGNLIQWTYENWRCDSSFFIKQKMLSREWNCDFARNINIFQKPLVSPRNNIILSSELYLQSYFVSRCTWTCHSLLLILDRLNQYCNIKFKCGLLISHAIKYNNDAILNIYLISIYGYSHEYDQIT